MLIDGRDIAAGLHINCMEISIEEVERLRNS